MKSEHQSRLGRVESGVPGLDTILNGGFLEGGLYIIQGPPGAGKTTIGNQICFHAAKNGGRVLYVTLLAEFHARMMQHLAPMRFFDAAQIPDHITYLNGLRVLHQEGLKGLLDLLRREVTTANATILVLDGIVSAQRMAPTETKFNEFVHELQGISIATDCTVLMLTSAEGTKLTPEHTMVDGIIELSYQLTGWSAESALQVIKLRGSAYLRGRHAFKISNDGVTVYPRIEALLARPSRDDAGLIKQVPSGTAELDRMMGGGLPASSTTMIVGPPGSGKTTLGLHFLTQCTDAEPGLLFGFYETPARIRAKADQVCKPLGALLDAGIVKMMWHPPTDGLLDEYGEQLLQAVHDHGIRRLVIDGLGALSRVAEPGRIGHFLTALINEMRVLGVPAIFTLEAPNTSGPTITCAIGDLSGLAENIILIRFVEARARLHRLISILKVRDSDFDPSLHEFILSSNGLAIMPTSESAEVIIANLPSYRQDGKTVVQAPQPPTRR